MKQRLDLSVRNLARPSSGAFDTRRRAVTRWAAELPVANLDETGQRLRHALAEVNGLAIPRARRLHLLETFGPKARMALDHLRRRYANQPLPLTAAADGAAQQAIDLLSELMRGYRTLFGQIITDGKPLPIWRRVWLRDTLVLSLHRFIHYGGELLAVYQAMHRNAPEGLWKRINRCYLLAEAHGIARVRVPSPADAKARSRITEEYLRLLLLSLVPVDGIPPAQWREVMANLGRWIALTSLARPPFAAGQQVHAVRLGRDGGPQPLAALDEEALASQNTRAIVIAPLCADLKARLARNGRRRFWRRETDVAPEVLQFLNESWCTELKRSERRDSQECPADVIVGLAALHHLLGGNATAAQEQPADEPETPKISLVPEPEIGGHHIGARADAVDVWQSVYVDPQKVCPVPSAPKDWRTQTRIDEAYRALSARLVDRSDHGCGVRVDRDAVRNVATGMLIALRPPGDDAWNVGLIARVTAHGDEVELGARMAGSAPVPAVLHTRSARGLSRFPAVVGRDDKGRRLLFAPAVPAVREGELVLELGDHRVPVKRLGNGAHARHVSVIAIAPLRPDDERHFDAAPVEEVATAEAQALPAADTAEPAGGTGASARDARVEQLMAATGMKREDAEFFLAAEAAHDEGAPPRLKSGGR
ncbi:MAG: hypothetical protein AB7U81_03965 [Thiohalomonadaceae bacterium]